MLISALFDTTWILLFCYGHGLHLTNSFAGINAPPARGNHPGQIQGLDIHVDLPGQHGNTAPHAVIHRDLGAQQTVTHVDLPGQHGNSASVPVVHRDSVLHSSQLALAAGPSTHVDLPGQHGNSATLPVVHRDHGLGHEPIPSGVHTNAGTHVDLPGQHGNSAPLPVVHRDHGLEPWHTPASPHVGLGTATGIGLGGRPVIIAGAGLDVFGKASNPSVSTGNRDRHMGNGLIQTGTGSNVNQPGLSLNPHATPHGQHDHSLVHGTNHASSRAGNVNVAGAQTDILGQLFDPFSVPADQQDPFSGLFTDLFGFGNGLGTGTGFDFMGGLLNPSPLVVDQHAHGAHGAHGTENIIGSGAGNVDLLGQLFTPAPLNSGLHNHGIGNIFGGSHAGHAHGTGTSMDLFGQFLNPMSMPFGQHNPGLMGMFADSHIGHAHGTGSTFGPFFTPSPMFHQDHGATHDGASSHGSGGHGEEGSHSGGHGGQHSSHSFGGHGEGHGQHRRREGGEGGGHSSHGSGGSAHIDLFGGNGHSGVGSHGVGQDSESGGHGSAHGHNMFSGNTFFPPMGGFSFGMGPPGMFSPMDMHAGHGHMEAIMGMGVFGGMMGSEEGGERRYRGSRRQRGGGET